MFEASLYEYIILSAVLFCVGIYGVLFNRKSIIGILISTEVMLLAANINFIAFSSFLHEVTGQLFAIFVLGVVAAEVGVGLAIIVIHFHTKGNILVTELNTIKDSI